ncbi:hypothetical protein NDN08_002099 [Rhodosorus marinus]|uniref:Uncharacterized protein n=1 Tax=Rhodosorus marinus TaxID=101924 RepID=A0AAV8UX59_9RHOD|nr:hypothetical protein NDN08_002099 [Rhodosorus marinus]
MRGPPREADPPLVPPQAPSPGPRPRFLGQQGITGGTGAPGLPGKDGWPGGNAIFISKHLNLTSLHGGAHRMLFLNDGSPGTPGGKGGPGQQGGKGSDGVSCSFHRTASGSSNDPQCCKDCDARPFQGYTRCAKYQAGEGGSGGPGGPGGPGGNGAHPGWVSVYSNSVSGAGERLISNEEAYKLLESSSSYGKPGSGGPGGDGGGGGVNNPNALCTTYKKDSFFLVEYKGMYSVKAVGVGGVQGPPGTNGTASGYVRPMFVRATTNAQGHPEDQNKFEKPQQWADLHFPEPAEYLGFGLELSENMLNSLAFTDDDEAAQNTYNLILQSVSDIMHNAQLNANRISDAGEKKVFSSYVNKARTLINSINRVSAPSGSSLGEVSTKSFESQLDDLDSFRVLAQEVEGYYDEYAKNVNDTQTSEKILAEATKSSLVGVQAQTKLQNELLTTMQQMNKTLDAVALNIHLVQMRLGDDELELDACWEKAKAILKFKTAMEFISFFTTVADFGFGATKLIGKASQVVASGEGWFKGIEAASGYKFALIPGLINSLEKIIPGPGQSANWAPYESSMKLISGDQSSLDDYTGELQNALSGVYRAKNYEDAQGIYEKMAKAQDDYKKAKIDMAKSEITNKVNSMKSACTGQAQNFFRNFDTLQMRHTT